MTNPNTAPSAAQPYAIDGVVYAIARKDQREAYVMFDTPAQANGFVEYMRRFIEKPVPAQTGGEAVAPEARADVLKQLRTAMDVVSALCDGSMRWTMSVPARPDSDPDLVISGALHAAEKLIAAAPPAPPAPLPYPQNLTPAQADARQKLIGLGGGRVGLDDDYEPAAPLPGKESAFLSAVATIYIDPHDERQELEYIGHIPRGELIRLYKAPNAVHADLLNVAIAVRDACHKAWVTSAENWRADVDVKSIVSAALSSPPAQVAPADYPPQSEIEAIAERLGATDPDDSLWRDFAHAAIDADRAQRSGVSADPLPLTDTYVQPVPDKCDRITWRGQYYHLPVSSQSQPLAEPVGEILSTCGYKEASWRKGKLPPIGTKLYAAPQPLVEPTADKPRFQWTCANGCGNCEVKRIEFEYERTETLEGELVGSKTRPQLVSKCCGAELTMWDNEQDEEVDVSITEPAPLNWSQHQVKKGEPS